MAGFGDGLPFTPWIADHIRRKDTQAEADLLAQARAGAAACLAGGVTTVADCCYAGTVAQAAGEAGLRAIVYLEGFSVWEGLEARIEAALDALPVSELVTAGVSPHAPVHGHARRLRACWSRLARRRGPAGRHPPARVDPRDGASGRVRATCSGPTRSRSTRCSRRRSGPQPGCERPLDAIIRVPPRPGVARPFFVCQS